MKTIFQRVIRLVATFIVMCSILIAGPTAPAHAALSLIPIPAAQSIAAGDHHTCTLLTTGAVKCWGANLSGQAGAGGNPVLTPQVVTGIARAVQVATGGNHSCALMNDATVRCWGGNGSGQLGFVGPSTFTPTTVAGLTGVASVALGLNHSCALLITGSVKCWGLGLAGQLGNGLGTSSATPVLVSALTNAETISAGGNHTCVIVVSPKQSPKATCWGEGTSSQLGNNANGQQNSLVPIGVDDSSPVVQVSAGRLHTCDLIYNGTVKCFGYNGSGQLGVDTVVQQSLTPVLVGGMTNAIEIATGGSHSCAVLTTGHVQCWGSNGLGQLGHGIGVNTHTPVEVVGVTTAVHITAGLFHTCAELTNGSIKCWGSNDQGQIGNTTLQDAPSPVDVVNVLPPEFAANVPARIMDTRAGSTTVDHLFEALGQRAAGSVTQLDVTGRAGVPVGAKSASLNITVTGAQGAGFLTAYPCENATPNASNLNYVQGDTVANVVIATLGVSGKVCIYTDAALDLIVDVNGYTPSSAPYHPLDPGRLLDTRPGSTTVDHQSEGIGLRTAGSTTNVVFAGRYGIPADALAVAINVTVTGPTTGGYVTVFPCGTQPPNSSTLNFNGGQTIANAAIAKIGTNGEVCIFTSSSTHVLIDASGYVPSLASSVYQPLDPARLLDTRVGSTTVDHLQEAIGIRAAKSQTALNVKSRGGVSPTASTVVLNVTVTGSAAGGYVTVWPCTAAMPNASNLNYNAGQTIANAVIAKVDTNGQVCTYTDSATELVADVTGYYP